MVRFKRHFILAQLQFASFFALELAIWRKMVKAFLTIKEASSEVPNICNPFLLLAIQIEVASHEQMMLIEEIIEITLTLTHVFHLLFSQASQSPSNILRSTVVVDPAVCCLSVTHPRLTSTSSRCSIRCTTLWGVSVPFLGVTIVAPQGSLTQGEGALEGDPPVSQTHLLSRSSSHKDSAWKWSWGIQSFFPASSIT